MGSVLSIVFIGLAILFFIKRKIKLMITGLVLLFLSNVLGIF